MSIIVPGAGDTTVNKMGTGSPLLKLIEERDPLNRSAQNCETCQKDRGTCMYFLLYQGERMCAFLIFSKWDTWPSTQIVYEPWVQQQDHNQHGTENKREHLHLGSDLRGWSGYDGRTDWVGSGCFSHPSIHPGSHTCWGPSMGWTLV